MQAVKKSIAVLLILIVGACQRAEPNYTLTVRSPDRRYTATFRGYEPGSTIESNLVLSFEKNGSRSVIFRQIDNGQIGWISGDTLVIIADVIQFYGLNSDYFPDGTVESRVKVIVCSKQSMDCSTLVKRLKYSAGVEHIAHFPVG